MNVTCCNQTPMQRLHVEVQDGCNASFSSAIRIYNPFLALAEVGGTGVHVHLRTYLVHNYKSAGHMIGLATIVLLYGLPCQEMSKGMRDAALIVHANPCRLVHLPASA